jgi:NAD(P)H-hydrate repair Nnr-like enzyme with NAD(P)H-hydrate dehydratase domain
VQSSWWRPPSFLFPETDEVPWRTSALGTILARLEAPTPLAIGPGSSTNEATADLVHELVRASPVPFVLDADA